MGLEDLAKLKDGLKTNVKKVEPKKSENKSIEVKDKEIKEVILKTDTKVENKEGFSNFPKSGNLKIKITALSPIHIGSGEVYEPTNYVIKDNYLYKFNEYLVLEKLIENNQTIPDLSNISNIMNLFKSHRDFIISNNLFNKIVEISKDISKIYEDNLGVSRNSDENINQMLINEHISTLNLKTSKIEPYIPASSIKGALQTVLNLSVEDSQNLKISDTTQINVKSQISWAMRKTEKSDIPQKLEVVSKGSTLEFYLTKKNRLSFEDLKIKLNEFYQKADNQQFLNYSKEIQKDNQFVLRVGRYCGQKFMVFEPNKVNPKTKTVFRKSEKDNQSELPFGWLLCEVVE